ncbi:hypothetical protein ACF0H5_021119 [Mactra antiquata]
MAEAFTVSGKKLVCSICQKSFQEMTVSSCFHTFCLDCLGNDISQYGRSNYHCPICNTPVTLPRDVINSLKKDGYAANNSVKPGTSFSHSPVLNKYCDICSDGRLAVSRCLQCEESLCQNCTNAHLKMKASRYHNQQVVSLDENTKLDYGNLDDRRRSEKYCWRHRGEEIKFYCRQCNIVLCLICKLMEHENHVTKPISEEAKEIRRKLNSLMQKSMNRGDTLHMKVQELEMKKAKYPLELDEELNKINYQASQMHSEIENEKKRAENELKSHYGNYLSKYESDSDNIRQDYNTYRSVNMEALQILNSDNDVLVIERGNSVREKLDQIDHDLTDYTRVAAGSPTKKFGHGKIDSNLIHSMMGKVQSTPKVRSAPQIHTSRSQPQTPINNGQHQSQTTGYNGNGPQQVRIDSRYEIVDDTSRAGSHMSMMRSQGGSRASIRSNVTDTAYMFNVPYMDGLGYVYGLAPTSNNHVWVSLLDHSYIILMSNHGDQLSMVEVDDVCENICSDKRDGCYVTCPRSRVIKHVTKDGDVISVLEDLPDIPHGICMGSIKFEQTEDGERLNELYVCFTDLTGLNSEVYSGSGTKGCVRIFSETGDDLEQGFVTQSPIRLDVHTRTNTLCISDHTNGCISVTDSTGHFVKALYTGENDEVFKPLGVCFDRHGNIIIADWESNTVSVIDQDGKYIRNLTCDIEGPQSVAVSNGRIWIGGKSGMIQVYYLDN